MMSWSQLHCDGPGDPGHVHQNTKAEPPAATMKNADFIHLVFSTASCNSCILLFFPFFEGPVSTVWFISSDMRHRHKNVF